MIEWKKEKEEQEEKRRREKDKPLIQLQSKVLLLNWNVELSGGASPAAGYYEE